MAKVNMSIEEAEAFFKKYKGEGFHMYREEPGNFEVYERLGISDETEARWLAELESAERKKQTRVLFVCHGNICRSVMAEYIMKEKVSEAGLESKYYIDSAAATYEEIGNPIYPPAERELKKHGIPIGTHRARILKASDYDDYDLIVAMDQENLRHMARIFGDNTRSTSRGTSRGSAGARVIGTTGITSAIGQADPDDKVRLMMEFVGESREVADPWYTRDFNATYEDLDRAITQLIEETK